MGVVPLATIQFFAESSEKRYMMESQACDFMGAMPDIVFSKNLILNEISGDKNDLRKAITATRTSVPFDGCFGEIKLTSRSLSSPHSDDWEHAKTICLGLLKRTMCSSVLLPRGHENHSFFGVRFIPAIFAPPDFARLSVLKLLDRINTNRIGDVVALLDSTKNIEKYCFKDWSKMAVSCKFDSRFRGLLK
jgi:hypothetical protein